MKLVHACLPSNEALQDLHYMRVNFLLLDTKVDPFSLPEFGKAVSLTTLMRLASLFYLHVKGSFGYNISFRML